VLKRDVKLQLTNLGSTDSGFVFPICQIRMQICHTVMAKVHTKLLSTH